MSERNTRIATISISESAFKKAKKIQSQRISNGETCGFSKVINDILEKI